MKRPSIILTALLGSALAFIPFASAEPDEHGHDHDHDHGHKHDEPAKNKHGHVDEVKLTSDAIQRYNIRVGAVAKQSLARAITVPARIAFDGESIAHVGSAVSGRATQIKVRVGQKVKKGDELVIVESPELGEAQSDYLQKRTAIAVAASAIDPARSAADRGRKLHEQNQGIALGEVQKREAEVKAAEGAVQAAQSAATAAKNKLLLLGMDQAAVDALVASSEITPHYTIRAPIDGQVIEREVTLGELVSPEKEALLVLANLNLLWVIADVPESKLGDVQVGFAAAVKISANEADPVSGTVSFISASLDAGTRTAQVRIEVANADRKLRPGMFASAEITTARAENATPVLAVPIDAVQTVEGGPAVFVPVEGEPNTFAKRAITVGPAVGGMIPVLSGLNEGDRIVVSGSFILKAELGKSGAAHEH